jgi:ribosomal protein L37E
LYFIERRLTHLEEHIRGGLCQKCGLPPDGPGRIVLIDDGTPAEGFPDNPAERCARCGRHLWCVLQLIYDEEGEGVSVE